MFTTRGYRRTVRPTDSRSFADWADREFKKIEEVLNADLDPSLLPSYAPTDAEYLVATSNGTLSAERVATGTNSIAWDFGTSGQAKANVNVQMSIAIDASGLKLSGDAASPGNSKYYGTDGAGAKGFHSFPSSTAIGRVEPQGRLTLTTGVPVLTSDVTAATTIYYTPYIGNYVPIYDGTTWTPTVFTELSQALSDATKSPAASAADKVYDMFVWSDSGVMRCTRGPAWTNDTTRGYTLTRQDGILLNTSAITNGPGALRGTYVGTIRTNASNQVDFMIAPAGAAGGGQNRLYVWNMHNRVTVRARNYDNTNSYTYTTATWRAKNNNANNGISFVLGLDEDAVDATFAATSSNATAGVNRAIAIGLDSTSAVHADSTIYSASGRGADIRGMFCNLRVNAGLGKHTLTPIEYSVASGTTTWYCTTTGSAVAQSIFSVALRM